MPALECPVPHPTSEVTVEVVTAGRLAADWKNVLNDGTTGPVSLPLLVGVLQHPKGTVLVDSGLGTTSRTGEYPKWPFDSFEIEVAAGTAMVERLVAPPARILMTHLHYDHIGGLLDFPGVEVWTTKEDWAWYAPGQPGFPPRFVDAVDWMPVDFGPRKAARQLGRPAIDVMGDGTIWYLSTPGHTPGAASVMVRTREKLWLFVGDTAWVDAHLIDKRRPFSSAFLVDHDMRDLDESLGWARALRAGCPGIEIVAGHEGRWDR